VIAKFPGICGACRKRFPAGATIHRALGDAYVCASCFQPALPVLPASASGQPAGPEEVRDTLRRAKAAAAKADALSTTKPST